MIKIIIIVLIGLISIIVIKQFRPEYSFLIRICVIATVLFSALSALTTVTDKIEVMIVGTGIDVGYIVLMVKVIGITLLTEIASGTCRDCSESALATTIELIGKIAVVSVVLPVIGEIIKLCISLAEN